MAKSIITLMTNMLFTMASLTTSHHTLWDMPFYYLPWLTGAGAFVYAAINRYLGK